MASVALGTGGVMVVAERFAYSYYDGTPGFLLALLSGALAVIFGSIGILRARRRDGVGTGLGIIGVVLGAITVVSCTALVVAIMVTMSASL